jgi:nitroreductase
MTSSPSFLRHDRRKFNTESNSLENQPGTRKRNTKASGLPTSLRNAMMNTKKAVTDYPIQPVLAERWSPYGFEDRAVSEAELRSLFEAARWAASSYNEQPWNYLVATKENLHEFGQLLSCLVEANKAWAKAAPVLVLGVVSLRFAKNNKDNRAAVHDLGLAAGNLLVEATARGLSVHQMIGILPDKAREVYQIPENYEAWTAMAIGYKADPAKLPDALKERDLASRQRKSLSEFLFTGRWGNPSPLALKG